jgi:Glyoxalase/Bleomycin resistance protein/Dioxygenase superfamily
VYEFGERGLRQIHLDAGQLFGFGVTFTERRGEGVSKPSTRVRNFQRVELLVAADEIEAARDTFTRLLGARFSPLRHIQPHDILTTTDDGHVGIELLAPASTRSPVHGRLQAKGRGGIGPLVWFVDDLDATRDEIVTLGYRVQFEYGEPGARQVHFDADQLYGFGLTFTERKPGEHL